MGEHDLVAEPGRLDTVVARLTGASRADVQRSIAGGRVLVDGARRPKSHRLLGGERIQADLGGPEPLTAEPGGVPVRYRDDHLMVVAKPAGMVTHPTTARRTGTLVNRLLGMEVPLSSVGGPDRPGIVHRLDAGTSGLLVVASDDRTHRELARILAEHRIDRTYLALVRGAVPHDSFTIDAPVGRRAGARMGVRRQSGREAITELRRVRRWEEATLLEARPLTGRTHQIRVHLSAVGHPVLGDRTYGGGGDDAARLGLRRPFLHAWRLALDHPATGERIEVEEPLSPDLGAALDRLGPART